VANSYTTVVHMRKCTQEPEAAVGLLDPFEGHASTADGIYDEPDSVRSATYSFQLNRIGQGRLDVKRWLAALNERDGWRANATHLVLSNVARPLRFIITGGLAGLVQLGLLALLTHHGWDAFLANSLALLVAAQLNFALSAVFTWGDRFQLTSVPRRWLLFQGSIAGTALLNMLIFTAAHTVFPVLVASALGIAVAGLGNFVINDRVVFRRSENLPIIDVHRQNPIDGEHR
jgi:putative flippase GtrA